MKNDEKYIMITDNDEPLCEGDEYYRGANGSEFWVDKWTPFRDFDLNNKRGYFRGWYVRRPIKNK
jgi:hypothetical protein